MAAVITTIAGAYTGSYTPPSGAPGACGILEDPGWRLSFTPSWLAVDKTDQYADAVIETIWRGFSNVGLDFRMREWNTSAVRMANPGATYATTGANTFKPGTVGRRGTDLAGGLVLTTVAGTPAASSPATATFTYVHVRSGFNVEWLMGPVERTTPMGLIILPYANSGAEYWSAT